MIHQHQKTFAPEGSQYERRHRRRVSKSRIKGLKKMVSGALTALAGWIIPVIYNAWMNLVWTTSKVENNYELIQRTDGRNKEMVAAMWHEDALMAPRLFVSLKAYTLASTSRIGGVITKVLEAHNFRVFRGGSGKSSKGRRRNLALRNMIYYFKQSRNLCCGIAVDGSKGPVRKMKPGIVKIAQACGIPIYLVSTNVARSVRLPTWDKTVLPLPFNRINTRFVGPFWIDPEAGTEERESLRLHLEQQLNQLRDGMALACKSTRPGNSVKVAFQPVPHGPFDLQKLGLPTRAEKGYEMETARESSETESASYRHGIGAVPKQSGHKEKAATAC